MLSAKESYTDTVFFFDNALRSRRSLNLSSTDFFLQNLVQLNYFQVLHYNLMHEL